MVHVSPLSLPLEKILMKKIKMGIMVVIHDGVATQAQTVYNGLLTHGRKLTKNYLLMNYILKEYN
ncbi:hypothetical protein CCS40_11445 (plasmid) [Candidatus Williamhamiltonella defendens]|nr:hypothetical protein CCS40_11445 [Candidatus Hamiltonella defensa]